ncbi:MAG: CoA transferase, partial [Pseudomonadota bacterium]
MARPFEGIRVLDLTHVLAGPYAAFQLAVQGADVVKIEPVGTPDCARGRGPDDALNALGLGVTYQVQGAGKRAAALDLKHPDGRAAFLDLVEGADVVLENFRAGAFERLGLGEATLRARRADLILASLTGWGGGGPREGVAAYDNVVQAAAGVVDRTGGVKPGLSFVDYAAGQAAAYAIACALFRRAREGTGQTLDVSMFETVLMQMAPEAAATLHAGDGAAKPKEPGIREYPCSEGAVMLGAFTPAQTARLAEMLRAEGF